MTNTEMPKNCPNCRNHCSVDTLRCVKGRQWKMIFMSKWNEKKQSEEHNSDK